MAATHVLPLTRFVSSTKKLLICVESAVARLVPLREARPVIADEALFARIVAAAFGQRRKTLRNALAAVVDARTLVDAGIDPSARGETLSVAQFVRLANCAA